MTDPTDDEIELLTDVAGLTPSQARVTELVAKVCAGAMLVGYSLSGLWMELKRYRNLRNRPRT